MHATVCTYACHKEQLRVDAPVEQRLLSLYCYACYSMHICMPQRAVEGRCTCRAEVIIIILLCMLQYAHMHATKYDGLKALTPLKILSNNLLWQNFS